MSVAKFNLIVRVVKNRIDLGENFNDVIKDYPKLTKNEIKQLKEVLGI